MGTYKGNNGVWGGGGGEGGFCLVWNLDQRLHS